MKIVSKTSSEDRASLACSLLKAEGICPLAAAQLVIELVKHCGDKDKARLPRVRRVLRIATDTYDKEEESVTFAFAAETAMELKAHRRQRTLQEIRYIIRALLKKCPELKKRMIRSITADDCRKYLKKTFRSLRQRHKARLIMSGVFTVAYNRGWCSENPVQRVETPILKEKEISVLTPEQIGRLMATASLPQFQECLPIIGLMLYAGIRPFEVTRLTWADISLEEKVISIKPRHSKTGGARHVTIMPPLEKILRLFQESLKTRRTIRPKNWQKKWSDLRKAAGWDGANKWEQDCLRHTFASYHAKHFRDYERLQWEMGHHSSTLLRTRYLNMSNVTKKTAAKFWNDTSVIAIEEGEIE